MKSMRCCLTLCQPLGKRVMNSSRLPLAFSFSQKTQSMEGAKPSAEKSSDLSVVNLVKFSRCCNLVSQLAIDPVRLTINTKKH